MQQAVGGNRWRGGIALVVALIGRSDHYIVRTVYLKTNRHRHHAIPAYLIIAVDRISCTGFRCISRRFGWPITIACVDAVSNQHVVNITQDRLRRAGIAFAIQGIDCAIEIKIVDDDTPHLDAGDIEGPGPAAIHAGAAQVGMSARGVAKP